MKQSKNIERKGKTREKEHICLIFICMHVYNKKKKLPSLHDIPTFFFLFKLRYRYWTLSLYLKTNDKGGGG